MAELVGCARCGRRFVESAADRVAGKLVCPACLPEAKHEAAGEALALAAAAAARKRQAEALAAAARPVPAPRVAQAKCDGCGNRFETEYLKHRYGKVLCAGCLAKQADSFAPAAPAAVVVPPCPGCGGARTEKTSTNVHGRQLKWLGLALMILSAIGCALGLASRGAEISLPVGGLALGFLLATAGAIVESCTFKRFWLCPKCDTAQEAPRRARDI